MQNKLWLLGLAMLVLYLGPLALLGWGDSIYPKEKVIKQDLLKADDKVIVQSTVTGDVLAFGSTVRSEGTISGDLLTLGNDIIHSGRIAGNARILGRELFIDGVVEKNLSAAGMDVTIDQGAVIKGNVLAAASNITVNGKVQGKLTVKGDKVTLAGEIPNNVEVYANSLTILPRAKFGGTVNYFGPTPAKVYPAATFAKPLKYTPANSKAKPWKNVLKSLAALLLLAVLASGLLPKPCSTLSQSLLEKPGRNLILGLAFLLALPPVFILLLWFKIGRFTGLALLSSYFGFGATALLLGQVLWGAALGGILWDKCRQRFNDMPEWGPNLSHLVQTLIGTLILGLIGQIPYLGSFLICFLALSTLGSTLSLLLPAARWSAQSTPKQVIQSM